jgi:UDP:flavonoid glycosyltransferase YjiC (YdhE family)
LRAVDDGEVSVATVVFFPEGAFGPTNNCVGIGDVLRARGHRVVAARLHANPGTVTAADLIERVAASS